MVVMGPKTNMDNLQLNARFRPERSSKKHAFALCCRRGGFGCFLLFALESYKRRPKLRSELALMPQPAHVKTGEGQLIIDGTFGVAMKGYTERSRLRTPMIGFSTTLARETGIPFRKDAAHERL